LLRAVRPGARSALVIGLGSGGTAGELEAAGIRVLAVELEAKVVELARRFFGYRGAAEVADGLEFAARDPRRWDVVLVDALQARSLPPAFLAKPAIALLRSRLAEGGVLAVRMVERPYGPGVLPFLERDGDWRFHQVFATGVGDEEQNLYLLDSDRPISIEADPALPVWPLVVPGRQAQPLPTSRSVTLLGYLVRVGEERALCLDLLHWEMGAVRFVIGGAAKERLDALIPEGGESPSSGDIGTDGDTSRTLHGALGGGDFKRSDVRYSPTVVAVRGTAGFRAAIDADDLDRLGLRRPAERRSTLLPWGGVLYDLAVDEIAWRFTFDDWSALRRRSLEPAVKALHRAARRGDVRGALRASREYVAALEAALGEWAIRFEVHRTMKWVVDALVDTLADTPRTDADRAGRESRAWRARACERAADQIARIRTGGFWENPAVDPLVELFQGCARRAR
jgi:hypothetical protein